MLNTCMTCRVFKNIRNFKNYIHTGGPGGPGGPSISIPYGGKNYTMLIGGKFRKKIISYGHYSHMILQYFPFHKYF